jgi:RNA recognition motif-containing protein
VAVGVVRARTHTQPAPPPPPPPLPSFGRYAHVTYATAAEASAAIAQLNGQALKGREVRAESSRPLEARPPREVRPPRVDAVTGEVKVYDRRVVVRGLPRDSTSEQLQAVFASCGTVVKARIGGGLGRVSFETDEAAAAALAKSGTEVSGATITVEKERMRPRRKRAPRRDGDEGGEGRPAGGAGAAGGAGGEPRPARKPRAPRAEGGAPAPRAPAAPRTGAPAAPRVAAPPRRVRVAGLVGMTPDMLRSLFSSIGTIVAAKVIAGKDVGFVTFEKAEDAARAVTLSGTTINSITINIELDVRAPRAPRPAGDAAPAAGGAGAARPPREPREPRPAREARPPRDLTNTLWVTGFPAAQMTVE